MANRHLAALCLAAALLTLSGCASGLKRQEVRKEIRYSAGGNKAEEWVCIAFLPIEFSDEDTIPTKAQIFEHNAVWDSLCLDDVK
ncbi:hypothetical protein [Salaquimonas pukyongi]|uniref:hypothetical protein n=1 Tax=Salaquimonas pukyongi TaxID=2712698 RepID=UPI0012EB4436|nr:hypothetical protein [Salaquimonas pukyongi]